MSDQTEVLDPANEQESGEEQRVPYERFAQANKKAKEAADKAATLQKQMDELVARLEERDQAGLPELERERKRAEALEKRIADAERRAEEADSRVQRETRKSLVLAAASKAGFDDPSDATRFPEIVNLDDIEDPDQAERAVKKLAKAKPRLLKDEGPNLPGRVLENGRTTDPAARRQPGEFNQQEAEAASIASELAKFSNQWRDLE
ncbi:MAG: hypothetical protein JWM31_1271 [Solirubrobacterales bacterium]|nr:hypothetical protein [Solirubrobacterales bacterium]